MPEMPPPPRVDCGQLTKLQRCVLVCLADANKLLACEDETPVKHSVGVHTHTHTVWALPLEYREVKQMAFSVPVARLTSAQARWRQEVAR